MYAEMGRSCGKVRLTFQRPCGSCGKWCTGRMFSRSSSASRRAVICGKCHQGNMRKRADLQRRAGIAVKTAVRTGALPHVGTLICADCGRHAQQYDHRDYRRPLDVAPVCRKCNARRGFAQPLPIPALRRFA